MVPENQIKSLVVIALEHAGIERRLLILPRATERQVEAEATIQGGNVVVRLPGQFVPSMALPDPVPACVLVKRESVILEELFAVKGAYGRISR